jgi:pSer/pThr/pTyr-binding forkhead associated (FHA) protein
MGRGHDSDLRVNDISVSRCHAIIKYVDNNYYLEDNLSKFGTLVLLRDRIEIEQNATKAVQIGRTVVSFTVKNQSQPTDPVQSAEGLPIMLKEKRIEPSDPS